MKNIIKNTGILLGTALIALSSCTTKDLDPTLAQSKSVDGSVNKVDNLYSILKGCHNILTASGYYGRDMIATNEVRSDNCFSNGFSGRFTTQASYQYNENTGFVWDNAYQLIANANIIIGTALETLEGDLDYGKHIQGQAMILRALGHFDLLRTYGQQHAGGTVGVPLILEYKGEDLFPSRNSVEEVKAGIYADLETAFAMMNSDYDSSVTIVSKFAAKALESRVAVYFNEWPRAKAACEIVINSGNYSVANAASFVSNWSIAEASNSIFELANSGSDNANINGLANIYRFPGDEPSGYGDIEVVSDLIDLYDDGDVRKDILGYQDSGARLRNMGKYPDMVTYADNIPLIRYEEVVLNYAEALFETGGDALTQLNSITSNRGAAAYTEVTKEDIINERRKELAFEGFRFDDLMRTGQSVAVIGASQNLISTLSYPNNLFAWPVPLSELNANSNMTQNEGY